MMTHEVGGGGVDGPSRRPAVVLVEPWPDQGLGNLAQAFGDAGQGLRMALQRTGQHGIEALTARTPVLAELHALLMAQRAQLVIVGGAERGLAVANEVESAHGAIIATKPGKSCRSCDPAARPPSPPPIVQEIAMVSLDLPSVYPRF